MNDENFKEWHEDDLSFHKNTSVSFSQCTPDRNMSWSEILRFTSDNAGEDFTKRGMSWPFLMEKGIAFVVSRVSYHVIKMPVADQRITFNTFECAPQGPLATRYYELVDTETKEKLITALSVWSILDVKARRMLPAKTFTLRPTPTKTSDFDGIAPSKIKSPEEPVILGNHKITYSDLDANGHTNNARYISFVLDVLPEEIQSKVFKDVRMNYSREAKLGENMTLQGFIDNENNKVTVIGCIENENSFECELYW